MLKIGICGSSGSGKSYICRRLREVGIKHIDTDLVYRGLVGAGTPCLKELCDYFGTEILNDDGSLNRKALSCKVFEGEGSDIRLKMLNSITHKYIEEETLEILKKKEADGAWATIIDAPVLFESGFDRLCQYSVCVTAPTELKIKRITERDGISAEKAVARLSSQLSDAELRARCDFEIINDDITDIGIQIRALTDELKKTQK